MELIFSYTRQEAIKDGVLVDVSAKYPAEVKNSGMKWPVAMTRTAWADFVEVHPAAAKLDQDENGRMWDVLSLLSTRPLPSGGGCSAFLFTFN
ncbi:MAG: hypothetical protein JEY71_10270 [Sphaerochaeta sp.]|nr:hypothetical protein [Sphaerochaeta sp.]